MSASFAMLAAAAAALALVVIVLASLLVARRGVGAQPCTPFGARVSDGSVLVHPVGSEVAFDAVVRQPFAVAAAGGVGMVTLTGPPGYRLYSVELDPQTARIASKRPMPASRVAKAGQHGDDVWVYGFKLRSMDDSEWVMLDK